MKTTNDAIALIRTRAPLNLEQVLTETDKQTGQPTEFRFADDHEFTVTLPAWVFRVLSATGAASAKPLMPPPESMRNETVTFRMGQMVVWPRSPSGLAQIDELRRTRIVLLYRRGRRICRTSVRTDRVAKIARAEPTLFALPANMLERGVLKREKTYTIR